MGEWEERMDHYEKAGGSCIEGPHENVGRKDGEKSAGV
jgi:hypothetical protein